MDVYEPAVADALNGDAMTNPHTHYDYDASGNEIDQIDAKGNKTMWTYDPNGNELSRTLPDGEQETFTYNQYGQEATHKDFDGNTATYTYYSQLWQWRLHRFPARGAVRWPLLDQRPLRTPTTLWAGS